MTLDASVGFTIPAGRTPESLTTSIPAGWTTRPAASSGGPSQQHHTQQETRQHASRGEFPTNCPHQLFVLGQSHFRSLLWVSFDDVWTAGVQEYTGARYHYTPTLRPSNDPRLRPQNAPNLSTDAHAPVPVHDSAYDGGAASTQWTGEATQCDPRDFIHLAPASPVSAQPIGNNGSPVQVPVTGSLPDGSEKRCVCTSTSWFPRCPRAQGHYHSTTSNPSQYPSYCGWALSKAQLPKCCPKAASHFLDWVSHDRPMRTEDVG